MGKLSIGMCLFLLTSGCYDIRGAVDVLACRASVTTSQGALSGSGMADDTGVAYLHLDEARLDLNGKKMRTVGLEPALTRVSSETDGSALLAYAEFTVQTRTHCRIYLLDDGSGLYACFEVSHIPGAEDREMTDDEIWYLFRTRRGSFAAVDCHAVYVEPRTADDAVRQGIVLPGNYVVLQPYERDSK